MKLNYFSKTNRGMIAVKKIMEKDVLLTVPRHLMITEEDIMKSPFNIKMQENDQIMQNLISKRHTIFQIWLLNIKNDSK